MEVATLHQRLEILQQDKEGMHLFFVVSFIWKNTTGLEHNLHVTCAEKEALTMELMSLRARLDDLTQRLGPT